MAAEKDEKNEKEDKKFKLPIRAYLMYLCVVAFLMTGITLSKYVVSTSGGDSARVAKFGDVTIKESGDIWTDTDKSGNYLTLQPGVNLKKQATVSFDACEEAVYVFVKITANGWTYDATDSYFKAINGSVSWSVNTDASSDGWTLLPMDNDANPKTDTSGNVTTAVYYKELEPNTSLENVSILKDETDSSGKPYNIKVSDTIKSSDLQALLSSQTQLSISFDAVAVQAGGFDSEEKAWESVEKKAVDTSE